VTLTSAERRLRDLAAQNGRDFGDDRGWDVRLVPVLAQATTSVKPMLLTLLGAAGVVLLLACTNVANLLLARGLARRKELAIRSALGAGRWRLARQLATESLVLGLTGGAGGLLVAAWAVRFARAYGPASVTRLDEAHVDARVVAFAIAIAVSASLATALAPLAQTLRPQIDRLKERGGSGGAAGAARLRATLVAAQIALALVLLVGGSLLMESFLRLRSTSPGFVPQRAMTFRVALPPDRYATRTERYRFTGEAVRRRASAPGIVAAGAIDAVPIGEDRQGTGFAIEGAPSAAADDDAHTGIAFPGPGYFEAIGLPVLRGRTFTEADRADSPPVAIISETLARQAFGDANPLGRRMRVGFNRHVVREIVGVVADDHYTANVSCTRRVRSGSACAVSWVVGRVIPASYRSMRRRGEKRLIGAVPTRATADKSPWQREIACVAFEPCRRRWRRSFRPR
jgi:putative ABC transport system permease protein